jgi:thiol-disulfide isomerase/thioredoxin
MLSKISALVFMAFFAISSTLAQTTVMGKVMDADGKPMLMANVFLAQPNDTKTIRSVQAGSDGSFKITIDSSGIWILRCIGVYHEEHDLALYIDNPSTIVVNVRLETYTYLEDFSGVKVNGSFNNWYILRAVPMSKQANGTYTAEIETKEDSIAYRLMYVRNGNQVEGMQADRYSYHDPSGYNSIVAANGGKVRIEFNPEQLVRSETPASVTFLNSSPLVSKFAKHYDKLQKYKKTYFSAYQNFVRERTKRKEFAFDWSEQMLSVEKEMKSETDSIAREELCLNCATLAILSKSTDTSIYRRSINGIPPSSIVWSLNPHSIYYVLGHSGFTEDEQMKYVQHVIDNNPIEKTKAALLLDEYMVEKLSEHKEIARRYYDILVNRFGSSEEAKMIKEKTVPRDSPRIGKPIPAFSVVSMDDSTKTITNESLRGKYYLMDFWASKNEASVREMQQLQEAYEKYKNNNFTIVSLSLDESPRDVVEFRETKWKLPWTNAFLGRNINSKVVRDFNAFDIPIAFLVDPTGNLVATGNALSSDNLRITLEKYLGK